MRLAYGQRQGGREGEGMNKQEIEKALARYISIERVECPVCIDYQPLEVHSSEPWMLVCVHCGMRIGFTIWLTKRAQSALEEKEKSQE